MSLRFGIDLGGSKIEIVALDEDGRELPRQRSATPQGDYLATITAIAALVEHAENELGQRGSVGIGIPGAESQTTGLIKNANSMGKLDRGRASSNRNVGSGAPALRIFECRRKKVGPATLEIRSLEASLRRFACRRKRFSIRLMKAWREWDSIPTRQTAGT